MPDPSFPSSGLLCSKEWQIRLGSDRSIQHLNPGKLDLTEMKDGWIGNLNSEKVPFVLKTLSFIVLIDSGPFLKE